MKKILLLTVFCLSVLLSACSEQTSNESASDEVYVMDINNWQPSTHHYAYNAWEPWKKMVEEKTNGRVKVNIYHGSALGKSSSVYQDIKGGLYDVSLLVTNYFYDTPFFPYTIGSLPFALQGPVEANKVLSKFEDRFADKGLDNVILMPPTSTDAYDLFSTTPIHTMEDLQNKKMRMSGKGENAFIQSLGGTPVSITSEGIYEGLEKGMIDTAFYTPIGGEAVRYYEPAPYITQMSVLVNPLIPVMNKNFYDQLPPDLQKLFTEELNPALSEMFTKSYVTELAASNEQLEKAVEKRGEYIKLSTEEDIKYREAGKGAWELWIEDANKRGFDGDEMVEAFFEILREEDYPLPFEN
ncbi:TRAP transporter substrate-binding protein DctP [Cytobacillus kochii]|uniref:TRAP transporter substrate-binding protein n=1 Tax=Cytobacillus kochii TaxID=859143 RepID=UPI002E1F6715|nr:TRAP transporter substrate-binding protein DctP [Cytobacillus kochii]MED1606718.1 TRAP transporter substrate-binding protein DctP [Cytobacillus kochii]